MSSRGAATTTTTATGIVAQGNTSKVLNLQSRKQNMAERSPVERQDSQASNSSHDSGYSSLPISVDELPHVGLQRNFIYLRSAIDLNSLKDWLIQKNVINEHLNDKLENIGLSYLRNEKLLKHVIRKGKRTSQEFLRCLRVAESGQCHIYEELKSRCLCGKSTPSGQHPSTTVTTQHLLTHRDIFLKEIEPQYVTDLLFEAEAFSIDDHDEVIEKDLRMKKAEKLWKILYKKNDRKLLDTFVRTLEFCKCADLLDALRGGCRNSSQRRNAGNHLLLVQQNYRYVVDNTIAEVLMHYLQAKNQLTVIECSTIDQYKSRSKQTRLVKCVIARGDEACLCLIDGLLLPDHNRGDILTELLHRQSLRPDRRIPQVNLSNTCFGTHYEFLKKELEVDQLIDVLLEELVLTVGDHNDVERCETRVRGAKHLIAILRKEPMEIFNTFVWALEHLEFKYIVDGLRKNVPVGSIETEVKAISTVEVQCNNFNNLAPASNLQDVNIECTITASGDLREAVHDGIVSSLHDNTMEFETSVISETEMEVEYIKLGSVVIHIHPLTDDAVQQLISAKNSNRMNSFVQSIIKHANLSFIEAGEKIKLKVELGVRKPNDGRQRQIEQRQAKVSSADIECSIKENWDFLLDELEPRDLTQHYITKGMFREEECKELLSGEMSRRDRVGLFLQSIVLGGRGQALDFFVKLLKDHGLMHIVRKLRLEPKDDVHARAECIRKKMTQNFSTLLEEVETPVISQTLKGCRNVTDTDKELLLPGGGRSRRTRVHEFLKMVLNNDLYLLEFERAMADHGLQDLIKYDPSEVNTQSGPSQQVSHVASGTITRIFTGSFTITIQREDEVEKVARGIEKVHIERQEAIPGPSKAQVPADRPHLQTQFSRTKSEDFSYPHIHEKEVVVAIDFGTTYSGYAFSFKDSPKDIQVGSDSKSDISHLSPKMPTSILLSPTKQVLAIGGNAEDQFKSLTEENIHGDHYFFRRFKMKLHTSQKLHRNTVIEDSNRHKIHAMEVFKLYIERLKAMLLRDLERLHKCPALDEIYWVLTIPAIWNDDAKQFMREAAEKAGIPPNNVTLALEPEVAALYVKECPVQKKGGALVSYDPGAKFLVMDLGGGTADMTIMEVTEKMTLKQLKFSCGGDWGGETVNIEYWRLLEELVGSDVMKRFKEQYKSDYLEMDHEFETKKRSVEDFVDLSVNLNHGLLDSIQEVRQTSLSSLIQEKNLSDLFAAKTSKLTLRATAVQNIFMPSLDKLLQATEEMLIDLKPGQIDIIMVGGFSDSKVVRETVKNKFLQYRVIEPQEAALAVLKGAVLYGHNPGVVSSRVCKYTYGIEVSRIFMKTDPPEYMIEEGGDRYCGKAFLKLVGRGQEIDIDSAVSTDDIEALSRSATFMSFNIYQSTREEPQYVTEEGCSYLGKLRVDYGKAGQKVKVWMRFGTSEIMVEGRDAETNEPIAGSVTLDLLKQEGEM